MECYISNSCCNVWRGPRGGHAHFPSKQVQTWYIGFLSQMMKNDLLMFPAKLHQNWPENGWVKAKTLKPKNQPSRNVMMTTTGYFLLLMFTLLTVKSEVEFWNRLNKVCLTFVYFMWRYSYSVDSVVAIY